MKMMRGAAIPLILLTFIPARAATPDVQRVLEIITTRATAIDLDGDGTADFHRSYGDDGALRSYTFDSNGDGAPDYEEERGGKGTHAREDRNGDGRFDRWYWEAATSRLERLDENFDGSVDRWIRERLVENEEIEVEVGEDEDGDGEPDGFRRYQRPAWLGMRDRVPRSGSSRLPISRSAPPGGILPAERQILQGACAAASGRPAEVVHQLLPDLEGVVRTVYQRNPAPGLRRTRYGPQVDPASCSGRVPAIRAAADRAVEQGLKCLSTVNPRLMCRMAQFLADRLPEISCAAQGVPLPSDEGEEESGPQGLSASDLCGRARTPGRHVRLIVPKAFSPACAPLEGVLFHEFLHNMNVSTGVIHSPVNPLDGVYGCEKACFPGAGASPGQQARSACQRAH